ncbi:pirin-like bicupin family protein [Spirosoma humi]
MTTPIQTQLYRADQRGCSETAGARSLHTLNFGSYFDAHRKPFTSLMALNDNLLVAGCSLNRQVDQQTDLIIIPIVGGLEFDSSVGHGFVQTGQAHVFSLDTNMELTIHNPYETENINFIEIWFTKPSANFVPACHSSEFDLATKNILLPLYDLNTEAQDTIRQPFTGFIGKYDGRRHGVYRAKTVDGQLPLPGIFVFVLSGVFEVQDRLLQTGDGLALTNTDGQLIEFEALSHEALLLLFEAG